MSFGTINVDVSNTVTPPIEDVNIVKMLVSAAGNMRHEHRESLRIANEKEQEKVEYEALRVQFQPFYDFIAKQTFVDKNNKELFEKASDEFRGSLR